MVKEHLTFNNNYFFLYYWTTSVISILEVRECEQIRCHYALIVLELPLVQSHQPCVLYPSLHFLSMHREYLSHANHQVGKYIILGEVIK